MSVIATPGGADSNAFCDIATADNYHSERLFNSEWKEASDDDKAAAIIHSTFLLNQQDWLGQPEDIINQSLKFPRVEVYDSDGRELTGIPTFLVAATCDLALELLRSESVSPESPLTRIKAGPIDIEYAEDTKSQGNLPKHIMAYIRRYLNGGINNVNIERA